MKLPERLDDLTDGYDAIFCDVWGVLHNGEVAFAPAVEALKRARAKGITVILVTNAPRPFGSVIAQMTLLGVPEDAYDRVVTSGDVTRDLIIEGPRKVFHIGSERELAIYEGLDVELVEEFEASGVVCTGLYDDETETPENYVELLQRLRSRNLPFICANPDIMVERGPRLIWCAGALARDYGQLGGRTLIAGKPHRPIYEAASKAVEEIRGAPVEKSRILGIGDGVLTDVKGAADYGLDVLYISGGVHAADYAADGNVDFDRMNAFLQKHGHAPIASLYALV
ncbi:TIGR01459 family HAD-type hydrolase [Brucella pseudogrignonensis]|jgi:HAD superfamily hydrolase (TIGR01459 family)|uniref:HAD hydrolase, IIA family protein n=1 Tax=Brucella pseudogrignonensis TaxID=419475 RepID=A0A1A9FLY4_9HYPH|nr:TIGR01459 family HAD-type hydrolase [Brucella pseudogrignonensis]MBK0022128.1 TIGR01459 family HAD-type hydrolase [Ochrobactrum sp. S45]MBK0044142.1 TIGR01459 family HAD-type hydrolase [Ochrobactrum sp. S46]ANG96728.1 HAD family hydrolase [Brucella pseudogrignonensis]KAB2687617.1 TIGR01459 family HAD-type hydrolase [Brucella pseudogrignonensis]MCM0752407.1 TIGR01459 family HAD-type hydrolase [Brucella pseudogrignonensis]